MIEDLEPMAYTVCMTPYWHHDKDGVVYNLVHIKSQWTYYAMIQERRVGQVKAKPKYEWEMLPW